MPGFVISVRFFPWYSAAFPYEHFDKVPDDAVGAALEALCQEWWSKPANRKRLEAWRRERNEATRAWNAGALARPGVNSTVPGTTPTGADDAQGPRPGFEEIAAVEGWVRATVSGDPRHGIMHSFPLKLFDSK